MKNDMLLDHCEGEGCFEGSMAAAMAAMCMLRLQNLQCKCNVHVESAMSCDDDAGSAVCASERPRNDGRIITWNSGLSL